MEKAIFKHIETILREYPDIDIYLHKRRQELMHPFNTSVDENIGGGRSNVPGKPVEEMAISIADDRQLAGLEDNKIVIAECMQMVDDETKRLIEELYFKKHPMLTLRGVADQLHSNKTTLSKKRTIFFELIKSRKGW